MRSPSKVLSLVMVLLCAAAVAPALGADLVLNRFDAATEVPSWGQWWGGASPYSFTYDATMDANGNVNSGALKLTATYATALGGNNNLAFFKDLGGSMDLTNYASLELDFYIDPSSPRRGTGTDHGYFGTFLALDWVDTTVDPPVTHYWDNIWEGGRGLQPDGAWTHLSIPLSAYAKARDIVHRIGMQIWGGDTGSELDGTLVMWIDNVVLVAKQGGPSSTLVVNDFNASDEVAAWWYDNCTTGTPPCAGQPTPTIAFDPTVDAESNAASGSMKVTFDYDYAAWNPIGWNQVLLNRNFPGAPADARDYNIFIARVKVDAGAPLDGHGGHGAISWVFRNNWGWNSISWDTLSHAGGIVDAQGWMDFEFAMPSGTSPSRDQLSALTLQFYAGGGDAYWAVTGPMTIWIDHIVMGRTNACADPGNCESCYNGVDDNGNGLVDCADPDCAGIQHCIESVCNDFLDNEGDGLVDCADPDCADSPACHVNAAWADLDGDTDVDMVDFGLFQKCISGPDQFDVGCGGYDRDHNLKVDSFDVSAFMACFSGPDVAIASCPP